VATNSPFWQNWDTHRLLNLGLIFSIFCTPIKSLSCQNSLKTHFTSGSPMQHRILNDFKFSCLWSPWRLSTFRPKWKIKGSLMFLRFQERSEPMLPISWTFVRRYCGRLLSEYSCRQMKPYLRVPIHDHALRMFHSKVALFCVFLGRLKSIYQCTFILRFFYPFKAWFWKFRSN
jgi:hypothetical protein